MRQALWDVFDDMEAEGDLSLYKEIVDSLEVEPLAKGNEGLQILDELTRLPSDFMLQSNPEESENLWCQFGVSSLWGGRRYAPHVFTEQGVAMLSSCAVLALWR